MAMTLEMLEAELVRIHARCATIEGALTGFVGRLTALEAKVAEVEKLKEQIAETIPHVKAMMEDKKGGGLLMKLLGGKKA